MADPDNPDSAAPKTETHTPASRVVLMADRADGAEELARALQAEGLSVLSCDVIALPERAARVDPFAVVVDIEQPNAAPALTRLLEIVERTLVIAAVGTVETARRLNLAAAERARLFVRPFSTDEVLAYFRDIARLDGQAPKRAPPSSRGSTTGIGAHDSDAILLSDFPAIAGLPEVESILPELDGGPISTRLAGRLSPEIETLLEVSARRVDELEQEQSHPGPESEVLVPAEMLAMVDDLLSLEDSPATRGGMDLSGMFHAPPSRGSEPWMVAPPSSQGAAYDSHPSWPTGIPEAVGSDLGSFPTASLSDEATGLAEGAEPADRQSDRQSDAPGTSIGLGEETSVPVGGTLVGHSSPLESSHAAPRPPSGPPTPGTMPPQRTETGHRTELLSGAIGLESELPPVQPLSSGPSTGIDAEVRRRFAAGDDYATDGPPDSAFMTHELSPHTVGQSPLHGRQGPASRDSQLPLTTLGQPPSALEPVPDSRLLPQGDPFEMLANAVRRRMTGALVLSSTDHQAVRRVLLRDGDIVTAASEHDADTLVNFLVQRGDLSPEVSQMRSARFPQTGRHAAAALIANGFLGQDDLWPVLRAHAEWIIARALRVTPSLGHLEREPPERLRAEPNVFGGAAGVEVFIESARRVLAPEEALQRLGGRMAVLGEGPSIALLAESALTADELDRVHHGVGSPIAAVLDEEVTGFEAVVYALVMLGILSARAPSRKPLTSEAPDVDPLDADAVRQRVQARMALVQEADYFALLGVPPSATSYEIRRAFLELRRTFEPTRLLTAATAELRDDVMVIVEVLEEAYQILRDPHRRSRYRRALEADGPS